MPSMVFYVRWAQCVLKSKCIRTSCFFFFFFTFDDAFWCFCCCCCFFLSCTTISNTTSSSCVVIVTLETIPYTEAGFLKIETKKDSQQSFTSKVTRKCQAKCKSIKITIQWLCVCMEFRVLSRKIRNRIALYLLWLCCELWHRLTVYRRFANIMWNCGDARSSLFRKPTEWIHDECTHMCASARSIATFLGCDARCEMWILKKNTLWIRK